MKAPQPLPTEPGSERKQLIVYHSWKGTEENWVRVISDSSSEGSFLVALLGTLSSTVE